MQKCFGVTALDKSNIPDMFAKIQLAIGDIGIGKIITLETCSKVDLGENAGIKIGSHSLSKCLRNAIDTASLRFAAPSFLNIAWRCSLTVSALMFNVQAMALFVSPSLTQ